MDTYHRWMEVVIGPTLAGLPANIADSGRFLFAHIPQLASRFCEDRVYLRLLIGAEIQLLESLFEGRASRPDSS